MLMKKVVLVILLAGLTCNGLAKDAAPAEIAVTVEETKKPLSASAGAFIGVTAGGDIEENEVAYGGQIQMPFGDVFFLELSAIAVTDTEGDDEITADFDVQSIGISIGAKAKAAKNCEVYGLFGPNYNMGDLEIDIDQTYAPGASAETDTDDSVGFHVAAGSAYNITPDISIFIEYRYTFLDFEGDIVVIRTDGSRTDGDLEGSFDFGVAKVGLNYLF